MSIQQVFANQDTRQTILQHYYNLRALDQYMNEFQQGQLFKVKFECLDLIGFFDEWSVKLLKEFKELIYELNPKFKNSKDMNRWEKNINECEIVMEYEIYHNYAILNNYSEYCKCYKLHIWGIVGKSKIPHQIFSGNRLITDYYKMYSDESLGERTCRWYMNIKANHEDINRMYPSRRFKKDFSLILGGIPKHDETHTKTAMKLIEEYEDREDYECSNYEGLYIYKKYLRDFICDDVFNIHTHI